MGRKLISLLLFLTLLSFSTLNLQAYGIEKPLADVELDSYKPIADSVQLITGVHPSAGSARSSIGQDFHHSLANDYYLTTAKFRLCKFGSPVGFLKAALYNSTTPGAAGGKPSGSALSVSTNVVSMAFRSANPTYYICTFTFDGAYIVESGVYYVIQCYAYSATTLDATSNFIGSTYRSIGSDDGLWSYYKFSTWYSGYSNQDTYFDVYGEIVLEGQELTFPLFENVNVYDSTSKTMDLEKPLFQNFNTWSSLTGSREFGFSLSESVRIWSSDLANRELGFFFSETVKIWSSLATAIEGAALDLTFILFEAVSPISHLIMIHKEVAALSSAQLFIGLMVIAIPLGLIVLYLISKK